MRHTHSLTHTYIVFHSFSPFLHVPVTPDSKKLYVCGILAWLNQMQSLFLLYPHFHGSQRTKQLEIFKFSRADSNTLPLLYRVSQLFPAILQGVIYDVNWNNFYPKHFSFLRRFKKLQNVANIDIFEKKICVFFF